MQIWIISPGKVFIFTSGEAPTLTHSPSNQLQDTHALELKT